MGVEAGQIDLQLGLAPEISNNSQKCYHCSGTYLHFLISNILVAIVKVILCCQPKKHFFIFKIHGLYRGIHIKYVQTGGTRQQLQNFDNYSLER